MENQPILSICIPTYKREYLIEKLINGIYAQNCDRSMTHSGTRSPPPRTGS